MKYRTLTSNYGSRRCDDVFLCESSGNVWKEQLGRCSPMMNQTDASVILIWVSGDWVIDHVWYSFSSGSYQYEYIMILESGSLKQNVWGDGRAVNCIRL